MVRPLRFEEMKKWTWSKMNKWKNKNIIFSDTWQKIIHNLFSVDRYIFFLLIFLAFHDVFKFP